MRARRNLSFKILMATVLAALAVGGLTACGGDDDGGAGKSNGGADGSAASGGGDREQIHATIDRLYAAMADRDAAGVCAELEEAAKAQVAAGGGPNAKKGQTCAESFQSFLDEAGDDGLALTTRAEVLRVKIDGDKAVARIRFGDRKGSPKGDMPLVKVDGVWKLEAVGGTPTQ